MNPGPLRSGQRVPNSPPDRFVCELGRLKHSLHSDQELTDSLSVSQPVAGCTYLSGPVVVRWQKREGINGGRGRFFQRAWQLLLSSRMPGHCSISLFWEVHSPSCSFAGLAGLPSDGRVDPGGMEEEHGGRETGREGGDSAGRLSSFARPGAQFRHS